MSLTLYTVYKNPKDYPDDHVIRRWSVKDGKVLPQELFARARTLSAVRRKLPPGVFNLGREVDDDACIVETWV